MGRPPANLPTSKFERKRQAILDGATAILNREGVKGLTLADAASAVGLSTTSVTYYFPRKDDLAATVLLRGIAWRQAALDAAMQEQGLAARLSRLVTDYVERQRLARLGEAGELPRFSDMRVLQEPRRREVIEAYLRLFRRTRTLFETPELPWLNHGRRTARTLLLLGQLSLADGWLRGQPAKDFPQLAMQIADLMIHGLATDGAEWSPTPAPLTRLLPTEPEDAGREAFLAAAVQLMNSRGYRGASVDDIAAALKVTKGSFYHHNTAKEELVAAAFERSYEVAQRALAWSASLPGDEWRRIASFAALLTRHQVSENGPFLRAHLVGALPQPARGEVVARFDVLIDEVAGRIQLGIAEGALRPVEPRVAAYMIQAGVETAGELPLWVSGVAQRAAPAVLARPLLMGMLAP